MSQHRTAKSTHYNQGVENYDAFNEENSRIINHTLEKLLKKYRLKKVLDMTCGTGSQVFWLAKRGFEVTGSDINSRMLKIATNKAKKAKMPLKFLKGDVRTIQVGKFDAVLTIFNSIGHLTKRDFEKAMKNIHSQLNKDGLYIFDIFNLSYLLDKDNITKLTIDWHKTENAKMIREIQFSTIDEKGILASYTTNVEKKGSNFKQKKKHQTLQIYTAKQLKEMLEKNGFQVVKQCGIDGGIMREKKTERILTIARKK